MTAGRPALAGLAMLASVAAPAAAQRSIATERDTVRFELAALRVMLDTARALRQDLEDDPRVLYSLGFGPPADAGSADSAYPWNAVSPTSDSTVNVVMPGNLREADRAYYNYAVMRMRVVRRQDPDASCDELVRAEEEVLSSYVDGWIVARTLFGGPAFGPMDELVFARQAGLLRPLLAVRGSTSVGVCASEWVAAHPQEVGQYESWRAVAFPAPEITPSRTESEPMVPTDSADDEAVSDDPSGA